MLLGAAVVVLVILSVVSLRTGLLGSTFTIDKAVVCVELDKDRLPHKVRSSIQYGVRQVCLWFQYSSAPEGNHLEISWYYENEKVLSESLKLMAKDGVRAFYLLQEEGTPLPAGNYKVTISSSTKLLSSLDFEIVRKQ
ncbi:hypothetical protein [Cloacibacillus sp. An23]|uniref:hypothetical protein n=1 Tax=Cloacibacillus sp. An23 TaxID=1965591 RepID=UPI0011788484|nr:hypothetical protein [Cloacibacillus sp. An23]